MKKTKKLIILIILSAICLNVSMLTGCGESYFDKEIGDFVVRFYDDCCAIKGTTAQGNEKKILVIPEYIEGSPVVYLGIERFSMIGGKIGSPEIESDKLEKVFFESGILAYPAAFSHCPNLKKKLFVSGNSDALSRSSSSRIYFPRKVFENSDHNQDLQESFHTLPANVSYCYNYENSENYGYYWIDDYDYGSKLDYIPKDPTREGYAFAGWYKEPECINKWDFNADTLPKEEQHADNSDDKYFYQETILYAKWI